MPPKRRRRKLVRKNEESEDTDNTCNVDRRRKSTRNKKLTPKPKKNTKHNAVNVYDADSDTESDTNQINLDNLYVKPNESFINKHSTEEKNSYTKIKDLKIRNIISPKSSSSFESDSYFDSRLSNNRSKKTKRHLLPTGSKQSAIDDFMNNPKNKENITPPDSHSTPALLRIAPCKLEDSDDSLFGFNCLDDSPLPFSPVVDDTQLIENTDPSVTHSLNTLISSPSKRKHEKEAGFNDVPVERPKKRQRKKRVIPEVPKDCLENLRSQFEEVEMHELAVE